MRKELERIHVPGEHEARERSWALIRSAFSERQPEPKRHSWRLLVAVAATLAVVAGLLSPPGRAVLDEVRDAVLPTRVERVEDSLFSLPSSGPSRLLVVSAEGGGVWAVESDGSRRRLGDYQDARWSPYGRFIVATRQNALLALTPDGEERWSLARRNVGLVAWGGTRTDTRIAYISSGLRVVGGDGTGDRLLAPCCDLGPGAWRPGSQHELLYLADGELRLHRVDSRRIVWRIRLPAFAPRALSWSADGKRVLIAFGSELRILDERGRLVRRVRIPVALEVVSASFAPSGRTIGVLLRSPGTVTASTRAVLRVLDADSRGPSRELFAGRGDFGELAWSPDGRHLLVAWRSADRWLFVNRSTRYAIAVEGIEAQFPRPDGRPPLLFVSDRWSNAP